jgi:hypothetical protein
MRPQTWRIQVVGLVSRRRPDGVTVAVPRGEYTMIRLNPEIYEVSGDTAPPFGLTRREVVKYLESKDLKTISRPWP